MGTATGYSPKRHGTSALAGQQGADTEAAQDAPHGDAGSRSGEARGRHRPSADARPAEPGTCIGVRVTISTHDRRYAKHARIGPPCHGHHDPGRDDQPSVEAPWHGGTWARQSGPRVSPGQRTGTGAGRRASRRTWSSSPSRGGPRRHQRPGHDRLHAARDPPAADQLDPGLFTRPRARLVLVQMAPATPVPGPAVSLPATRLCTHLRAPGRRGCKDSIPGRRGGRRTARPLWTAIAICRERPGGA